MKKLWIVALIVMFIIPVLVSAQPVETHELDLKYDAQKQWDWLVINFNDRKMYGRTDRAYKKEAGLERGDDDPVTVILRRTESLLADIKKMGPTKDIAPLEAKLDALKKEIAAAPKAEWDKGKILMPGNKDVEEKNGKVVKNKDVRFPLFEKVYMLQREIAFANPLLDFDKVLFIKRNPPAYAHMVDQYLGITQHPGGGLYVLDGAFTDTVKVRDVLADATVENGRLQGKKLVPGSFLSPDVSFDGEKILFAFTELKEMWIKESTRKKGKFEWGYKDTDWSVENTFHIFSVNADGSNLQMLTDGPFNDFDPCFIPNGRIAFISERRGGQGRCHPGRNATNYVLHSMLPDGADIVPLSYHETNEWSPSINNQGEIVYSRWDYVDRDVTAGEYPWVTKPDGRDARAIHGNYDKARLGQTEFDAMAIPNTDSLYLATLSQHHNSSYGSIARFDASVWDYQDEKNALMYFTPDSGSGHGDGTYATPWPLGENYALVVFSPLAPGYWNGLDKDGPPYETPVKHGIYVLDAFGNKILVYRDKEISLHNPIPFRSRPTPPRIPHMTTDAYPPDMQNMEVQPDKMSTVAVMNVYNSLFPMPEDRKIESLRIVQLYPKPTIGQDNPRVGYATMMNARRSLGTVPVEEDGSVHFQMPPKIPVYFQALDKDGLAIQSMKSAVYTHPGEMLSCQGCHEPKVDPVNAQPKMPVAMKRAPSELKPDVNGEDPIIFARLVQPVLDAKCVDCHAKNKKAPGLSGESKRGRSSESYNNLEPYAWYVSGRNERTDKYQWKAGSRSIPGENGAYVSKLYKILTTGSHKDKVKLTDEEMDRLTLWMDLNSPFLGSYYETREQANGDLIVPRLY